MKLSIYLVQTRFLQAKRSTKYVYKATSKLKNIYPTEIVPGNINSCFPECFIKAVGFEITLKDS